MITPLRRRGILLLDRVILRKHRSIRRRPRANPCRLRVIPRHPQSLKRTLC
jgi:hypothetical protein